MLPLSHFIMLVAAFFGADLSKAEVDIERGYEDPDVISEYCYGYDSETEDWHNDYAEDWYAWERCMLGDAPWESTNKLGKTEAEKLVGDIWTTYAPWMRNAFVRTMYFFPETDDDWYHIVLPEDWVPPVPKVNTGSKKIKEHCSEDVYGCAPNPSFSFTTRKQVGETVWWWADSSYDTYQAWTAKLKYESPGRIVTPKRNRFNILHELAHNIDQYQHVLWEGEEAYSVELEEDERTGGHGIEFRCLLLDLYNNHGVNDPESSAWKTAYTELRRMCQIIAPDYAQPVPEPGGS